MYIYMQYTNWTQQNVNNIDRQNMILITFIKLPVYIIASHNAYYILLFPVECIVPFIN